jgi:hypothetical protein
MKAIINQFTSPATAIVGITLITIAVLGIAAIVCAGATEALCWYINSSPIY